MENLKNKTSSENQENKKLSKEITDLKKQVENLNKPSECKIENKREENQKDDMEKLSQSLNNMIVPNLYVDPNFIPVSTAFQWKVKIDADHFSSFSPLFYNIVNGMCFQLEISFRRLITLYRYRGIKYQLQHNRLNLFFICLVIMEMLKL